MKQVIICGLFAVLLQMFSLRAALAQNGVTFQYFYDDLGQLTKVVDSTGTVIEYVYDPVSNIVQIRRSSVTPGTLAVFGFTPRQGPIGQTVTIQGQAFDSTPANNIVQFNGTAAAVISATATTLLVTVPPGATTGPITVSIGSATASSSSNFTVLQVPVITSISPNKVNFNTTLGNVQVTGFNLAGASFSFVPVFSPPALTVSNASIDPSGTSAMLNVAAGGGPAGIYVLIGSNAVGNSSILATAGNTLQVIDPSVDVTPPTISITGPSPGAILLNGQTLNVTVNATDNVGVAKVDFTVNGTVIQSISQPSSGSTYSFAFTVPASVNTLTFGAEARDAAGNVGTASPVQVSVQPDSLTTVTGHVVDANTSPVPGAQVNLQAQALRAEFFKFSNPLTTIPDLTGRAADVVQIASAINMRNPNQLFGSDPFGVNLGLDYAGRFTSQLQISTPGKYTFKLGADEAARLKIGGVTVIDIPSGVGVFEEATGTVNLVSGVIPVEVSFIHNLGAAEIQLSFTPPSQNEQVIRSAFWLTQLPQSATSDAQGAFSIPNIPAIVGGIQASATATVNGVTLSGVSNFVAPVPGGTTDLGNVVVVPSRWIQLTPPGPPDARFELGEAVYDEVTDRMMIFGGIPVLGLADRNDVWVLAHASGTTGQPEWIKLNPIPNPGLISDRSDDAVVYDAAHNRMIVFGGFPDIGSGLNDVWVLDNANGLGGPAAWTQLSPQGVSPTVRADPSAAYDANSGSLIIFAGQGLNAAGEFVSFNEVWVLNNANGVSGVPTWTQLFPTGGPPAAPIAPTATFDAQSNRMTVFGGMNFSETLGTNAVWVLTNANGQGGPPQWINVIPEGSIGAPGPRGFNTSVYDSGLNRMIVFGGCDFEPFMSFSDTWILTSANGLGAAPSWLQLPVTVTPDGRCFHTAVFDSVSNRMIIFGGETFTDIVNDTWVLTNANGLAATAASGGTVLGQVNLAGGTPAPGALVRISTSDGGTAFSKATRTDGNGGYVVSGIPAGRTFAVRAFDPNGISFRDSLSNSVGDGQALTVSFTLPTVAAVRVAVVNTNGSPVIEARIAIQDSFKQFFRFAGLTDANGTLEIPDVPEGGFAIQAQDQNTLATLGTFNGTVAANNLGVTINATITTPVLPVTSGVLVASGITDSSGVFVDTAEVFNPSTGIWTPAQNRIPNVVAEFNGTSFLFDFLGGLCGANMVALGNGTSLFAGGICSDIFTTNAASVFIPGQNQWFSTNAMFFGRDRFGMVTLKNGDALAFAGCADGCGTGENILFQTFAQVAPSAEIYDFQTSVWTQTSSLNQPRGNFSNGNFSQTAATLLDGRVLACNGSDGSNTPLASCEIYDPVANQWIVTASIGETGPHPVAVLPAGKVLTIMNDGMTTQLFDPTSQRWSTAAALASQQSQGILTVLSNGDVLLSGGSDANGPVATVQIYHFATDTWSATAAMSTPRNGHIGALLPDGTVLVAGGVSDLNFTVLSSAEIYDPVTATWTATGSMSQPRFAANAVAFTTFK